MIRKQVFIDEDLERRLKILAAQSGRPEAEQVREALRSYLVRSSESDSGEDPLLGMIGLIQEMEGPRDVAREHDHYLSPKQHP
jgi:hypothetical protein